MKNRIVFDLDDTICFPNHSQKATFEKYMMATPNDKVVKAMRDLKERDFYIIIHSARRMLTHNGDLAKIIEDVGDITKVWLKYHDVPYDELIFGKPYANTYYVDDKAMNLNHFDDWYKQLVNEKPWGKIKYENSDW